MNSITESIQLPRADIVPCLFVEYDPVCENRKSGMYARLCTSVMNQKFTSNWHSYINSITNIGYTRAMNKLLTDVSGYKYTSLLNQDVELKPDAIENAVRFMDEHPRCAIAGFKQLDANDPDIITHGGTGSPYPAGVHLTGRVSNGDHNLSRKFLWVNGAAMIVRLEALKDIGLMDERFFNIGSDSDWCLTTCMRGWEVWYCAEAVCLHETHGCSREPNPEQQQIAAEDMRKWGEKWSKLLKPMPAVDLENVYLLHDPLMPSGEITGIG